MDLMEILGNIKEGEERTADLNSTGDDYTFGDYDDSDEVMLDGLKEELEKLQGHEIVANILGQGSQLSDYTRDVEEKLRLVELESIQDYMKESDNLVSLHTQIRECDNILAEMEALLGGFQSDLGSISSEIKSLQEQSMSMGLRLKNRRAAELKLSRFIEEVLVSPNMIDTIVDGEVNEEYLNVLRALSKKLHYLADSNVSRDALAIKDVEPELQRLRSKAISKTREFLLQKLYALRRPKTNIQILQQNVLLKYKYVANFLREHGKEVYPEIRLVYVDTMSKVLSAHFRSYIQALERLQLDIVTRNDLLGVEDAVQRGGGLFSRAKEPLKTNKAAVFSLGDRASILKDVDEPAIIPHIAEGSGTKFPYEVLFRSLHKLLMDTATSEYLFCSSFFAEDAIFYDIFVGPFGVINEHLNTVLPNSFDAIGLMLMIRLTYHHQLVMSRRRVPCLDSYFDKLNLLIWPRFKLVFDMHLGSIRAANVRTLWEDDVRPHYVTRRYAEFAASLLYLNKDYGDGQVLDLNLERLRIAVDDLLVKLARLFRKPKQQTIFLINNYDMVLAVLKETGVDGGKTQHQFEDLLKSNSTVYVEEELREHFEKLITFVKTRAGEDSGASTSAPIVLGEVEPLVKDFGVRWIGAIELMHKDVITSFSNFVCGMEILRAALTQLLLYYTRLSDCLKSVPGAAELSKDVVSISTIMFEIKKYSRTF